MLFVIVVSLLILGAILIIAGVVIGLSARVPSGVSDQKDKGGDNVTIEIGRKKLVFRGPEAALFTVLGSLLVLAAMALWFTSGTDRRDTSAVRFSAPVYAQPRLGEAAMASGWETGEDGWVYLGPKNNPEAWVFRPTSGTADGEEVLDFGSIVHATGPALVREGHGSDFSGTFLGIFVAEPRHIATVSEGDCARVMNREEVGFRSLWIKVEKTDCPEQ